jgi:aerobic-type carbon monoxide dehydrogenase small subunit (CoxS/CutS family)
MAAPSEKLENQQKPAKIECEQKMHHLVCRCAGAAFRCISR